MSHANCTAIVLAAGMGKRMKSNLPKVLHTVLGEPMLDHVLWALAGAGVTQPVVVVGHGAGEVRAHLGDRARTALQAEQLGTGHAVKCALEAMSETEGTVVVACGDTPLLTPESFRDLLAFHRNKNNSATVLSCVLDNPAHYGRIIRNNSGGVTGIVEFRDASAAQRNIQEINSGTYCFELNALRNAVNKIANTNDQKEYYLTDTIHILATEGHSVDALSWPHWVETTGVNSPVELAEAEDALSHRIHARHMVAGVVIESRATVRIGPLVEIGAGTRLLPGTIIEGRSRIGEGCRIGPNVRLVDVELPPGAVVGPQEMRFPRTRA
jgi:bifunctional UDP-N-acetylglucosamine pyrophosphorylase/glucosamine-1-phosphate N-acetyltransferase